MDTIQQLVDDKLKPYHFQVKKETAHLATILLPDEQVVNLAVGDYRDRLGKGLLAVTDRRVIFIEASGLGGRKMNVEDIALSNITSVSSQTGKISGTLDIAHAGGRAKIEKVTPLARVDELANYLRERVAGVAQLPLTPAAEAPLAVAQTVDVAAQLRQLVELHTTGLLTDDEYQANRAELIARL